MSLDVAVRQVLLDLGFERKFDPDQPRDPDGKFGDGLGVASVAGINRKVDKLRLDGRIKLQLGERLVASGQAKQADQSDVAMPIAVINTPTGPQVRLGVDDGDAEPADLDADGEVAEDSAGQGWSGNNPATTVRLDAAGMDQLRDAFARENASAKTRQQAIVADWDRMDELRGDPDPAAQAELAALDAKYPVGSLDGTIGSGIITGLPGGGDLAYQVRGEDDGEAGWEFTFAVKPPDAPADWNFDEATENNYLAGQMSPKQVAAYQRQIASMIAQATKEAT